LAVVSLASVFLVYPASGPLEMLNANEKARLTKTKVAFESDDKTVITFGREKSLNGLIVTETEL
jgi:hypothetical protein